jgi:hypothetical protein
MEPIDNHQRYIRYLVAAVCLLTFSLPVNGVARPHLPHLSRHGSTATLRKRLHVNDLITEPGTAEIDWGSLYSFTTSNFTMPSALKYTPAGSSVLWGRTEYSIAFDSISSAVDLGTRSTQFSDRITLTGTSVVFDSTHFDIAVAPQATFLLRDASGMRLGATAIAREDIGLNSMGATVGWNGATSSSASNPAGTWDFGGGFGRHLASTGLLGRFTPHVNLVWERSTGFAGSLSTFGGVEYQVTPRVAFDASGQRIGLTSGADRQVLFGMTINLGKISGQ